MAALWQHGLTHFYQQAIFVGLLCSVVGDIFLMLPRDRFIQGLGGFLVAISSTPLHFGVSLAPAWCGGYLRCSLAVALLSFYYCCPH